MPTNRGVTNIIIHNNILCYKYRQYYKVICLLIYYITIMRMRQIDLNQMYTLHTHHRHI